MEVRVDDNECADNKKCGKYADLCPEVFEMERNKAIVK